MSVGDFDRKTIIINSQFRESGTSSQFNWRFQERVENIRHAELRYFVLENGVYNVDSTNNTLYLSEEGSLTEGAWTFTYPLLAVSIPSGYYDDTTLAATIGLCMSSVSSQQGAGTVYFVQMQSTGIISISSSTDFVFAVGFNNGTIAQAGTASLLGFNNSTTPNQYNSATYSPRLYRTIVGDIPCRLASFDYVLVQSQKLGNDLSFYSATSSNPPPSAVLKPSATSCFAFVPNYTPSQNNATIIFENQRQPQISTLKYPYSLDYVDITIVDKYGQPVALNTNNVHLVIELYTDKTSQALNTGRSV